MTIPPLQTKNDVCDDAGMVCSLTSFHYSTAVVVVVAVDVAELLVGCDGDDDVAFDVVAAAVVVAAVDYCLSLTIAAGYASYVYYWASRRHGKRTVVALVL